MEKYNKIAASYFNFGKVLLNAKAYYYLSLFTCSNLLSTYNLIKSHNYYYAPSKSNLISLKSHYLIQITYLLNVAVAIIIYGLLKLLTYPNLFNLLYKKELTLLFTCHPILIICFPFAKVNLAREKVNPAREKVNLAIIVLEVVLDKTNLCFYNFIIKIKSENHRIINHNQIAVKYYITIRYKEYITTNK